LHRTTIPVPLVHTGPPVLPRRRQAGCRPVPTPRGEGMGLLGKSPLTGGLLGK